MLRILLAVVGLIQLVFPDAVVATYTRLAYEGPEAFRVRRWVTTAMRLEGFLLVYLAVRGFGEDGEETLADQASRAKASVPLMFSM